MELAQDCTRLLSKLPVLGAPLRLCRLKSRVPTLGMPRLGYHLLIWVSMPGTHPDELVSCPLFVLALFFIFGQPRGSLP